MTLNYNVDKEKALQELHEEDSFGEGYFLRSLSVNEDTQLRELLSGKYILWQAY